MSPRKNSQDKRILRKTLLAGLVGILVGCTNPLSAPIPPSGNELSPNTHVLTSGETALISSVSDNSISFSQNPGYSVGDIIVSDISSKTPYGLLRKVSSISGNTVYTTGACLEDAIKNASFESSNSSSNSTSRASKSLSLLNINWNIPPDSVLLDLSGDSIDNNDEVKANGSVSLASDLYLKFKIENNQLKQLTFKNITTESLDLRITSSLPNNLTVEKEIVLYEVPPTVLRPFMLGYLPTIPSLPIIVIPKLQIVAGLSDKFSITSDAVIGQSASLVLGLDYNNGTWTPIKNFSNVFTDLKVPSISQANSLKAYLGGKIGFYLYGIAGPYGRLDAYMKLTPSTQYANFYGGLEGILGVDAKIFGLKLANYSSQVLSYEELLGKISITPTPPSAKTLSVTPTQDAYFYTSTVGGGSAYYRETDSSLLEIYSTSASNGYAKEDALIQFSIDNLPSGSSITSAKLKVYGSSPENTLVYVKKILNSWTEANRDPISSEPSLSSYNYSSFSMNASLTKWYECDITPLVNEWKSGTNYGLALTLNGSSMYTNHLFNSSESVNGPVLEINYY